MSGSQSEPARFVDIEDGCLQLIAALNIRVINADTGQRIRERQLDRARDYQPSGKHRYARWQH